MVCLLILVHPLVGDATHLLHVHAFGGVQGVAAAGTHAYGVTVDLVGHGDHLTDHVHLAGAGLLRHRTEQQQGELVAAQTESVVPAADASLQPLGNALQQLTANGASPNAFTSNAVTAYYFDCTEHFYENLRILLSFVSVPYFTDESVEKEQGIIAQEIGMIEDNPEWQVYRQMMQALYRHSPVRQSVAGSVESIRRITAQTLYDCHKAFYTPANMCLVVVGDVDPEEVLRAAREVLPRESGPAIPRDYGREEDLTPHMARIEGRMEVAMPTFLLGFKCPPVPEGEERMRLDILGDLACDVLMGESSPLFTRLYSQGLINGTFDSAYDLLPGAAYVFCGGDSNDPEAVQQAVLDEARRVVREGVDPAYVQRIRRASFGASIKSLNSFEAIASTAAEGCFQGYDPFRFPEVYDSITQQDLLDFIRDNIRPERMALSIIYPKE